MLAEIILIILKYLPHSFAATGCFFNCRDNKFAAYGVSFSPVEVDCGFFGTVGTLSLSDEFSSSNKSSVDLVRESLALEADGAKLEN